MRSGVNEWIFYEEPCDRGEGYRPVHQYQPRCPEFPQGSYFEISNEADAQTAVSDQIKRIDGQGYEIQTHALNRFYALLVALQTAQYRTFSSLLYWRNTGDDDLQEPEVLCSDILIAPLLCSVEILAQEFYSKLQQTGVPKSGYRRSAIRLRLTKTVFGTKDDPKPLGYVLEMKVLGAGNSRHQAVNQWVKAIDRLNSTSKLLKTEGLSDRL